MIVPGIAALSKTIRRYKAFRELFVNQREVGNQKLTFNFDRLTLGPIGARAHAKLSTKRAVEVGNVAKTACERNIGDFRWFFAQTDSSAAHSQSEYVLVGRRTRNSLEHPKEVVGAQASDPGQALQVLWDFGIIVDHSEDSCDAGQGTWLSFAGAQDNTLLGLNRLCQDENAKLPECRLIGSR